MLLSDHDVVWIQTAFLGDIILTTASFDAVKKLAPHRKQVLITTPIGYAALKDHPSLDAVVVFDKKKTFFSPFKTIKHQVYQSCNKEQTVVLQLHKSLRSTLLAHYLGSPIITYKETVASFLAFKTVPRIALFHEAQRQGLLLEPLGVSRESIQSFYPSLPKLNFSDVRDSLKIEAEAIESATFPLIGIAAGSVWGTKKWPADSFALLVQKIISHYPDVGIVLIGSNEEKKETDLIAQKNANYNRLWNLAGKTSLNDLRWLYPKLSLLISNDSSPIHYASAFNIPTIAIFGATSSSMGFGPLASGSQVIENKDLTCRPCSDHGPKTCPLKHFACMKSISPDRVMELVRGIEFED